MTTTPAKKYSVCRRPSLLSHAKRKALRRRARRAFRIWQRITRSFAVFRQRSSAEWLAWFRSLRLSFGAALVALWLPALAQAETYVVNTTSDVTDPADGVLTLREAIDQANASAGPDTVHFDEALSGEVIVLTQGELAVSDSLEIDASGLAGAPVIDAAWQSRVLAFNASTGDLELTSLILRHGKVHADQNTAAGPVVNAAGGCILFRSSGTLTLTQCGLTNNSATSRSEKVRVPRGEACGGFIPCYTWEGKDSVASGGGIYSASGSVVLKNSTVTGCFAGSSEGGGEYRRGDSRGGAITTRDGSITLLNSTIEDNLVESDGEGKGGGIYSDSGPVTLINSSLQANAAQGFNHGRGGGIATHSGNITLQNSILQANAAQDSGFCFGGGIATHSGNITIQDSILQANAAQGSAGGLGTGCGGGMATALGRITVRDSILQANVAEGYYGYYNRGGGIYSGSGPVTIQDSTLQANKVKDSAEGNSYGSQGGGIFTGGPITILRSLLHENYSDFSGGGIEVETEIVTITDSTVSGNIVSAREWGGFGGGICSRGGKITLTNSTIAGNSIVDPDLNPDQLDSMGAGIYSDSHTLDGYPLPGGSLTIINSTISGNSIRTPASAEGSGIYTRDSYLILRNSVIGGNSAGNSARDLNITEIPTGGLEVSHCMIGNSEGARLEDASVNLNNLIDVDPRLGPLGDHGGPTPTIPLLPGSPAIGAGTVSDLVLDQRGFPRVDSPDIGAVEYQGRDDLLRVFEADSDGDGIPYAVEQALGTDPQHADADNPRHLHAPTFDSEGRPVLSFGIAEDAAPGTLWILERTTDLATFAEIHRFDGSTHTTAPGQSLSVEATATGVRITDLAPPPGRALYRLRIEFVEAE